MAYDADVVCDLILSYGWLAQNNVIPHPKRHGLLFTENPGPAWVPAAITRQSKDISTFHTQPHQEETQTVHPGNPEAASTFAIEQWELEERRAQTREYLRALRLHAYPLHPQMACPDIPGLAEDPPSYLNDEEIDCISEYLLASTVNINYIRGFVSTNDNLEGNEVEDLRKQIFHDFKDSVFIGQTGGNPPKRCEFGEAEIHLQPNATPVKQRPYQMSGDRRKAWIELVDQLIKDGKIEPGQGPWCSPSFPVPKKQKGNWRLVVDYRRLNQVTEVDSHPLPRISDILQGRADSKFGLS